MFQCDSKIVKALLIYKRLHNNVDAVFKTLDYPPLQKLTMVLLQMAKKHGYSRPLNHGNPNITII